MKDQYDQPVPTDLVVVDFNPNELTDEQLTAIDKLDWYQPNLDEHPDCGNYILMSYAALDAIGIDWCETDTVDTGIGELKAVLHIDAVLHRWSEGDGFYHA